MTYNDLQCVQHTVSHYVSCGTPCIEIKLLIRRLSNALKCIAASSN